MRQTLRTRIGLENHVIKNDEFLVFYKKGSNGQVVGVYESVIDFVKLELYHNKSFRSSYINDVLKGRGKCFYSKHHGCMCVPRIVKKEKLSA